jgi:hypothetical protein
MLEAEMQRPMAHVALCMSASCGPLTYTAPPPAPLICRIFPLEAKMAVKFVRRIAVERTVQNSEICVIGNGYRARQDAGTQSDSMAVFGKEYSHLTTRERKELRELKLQRLRRCHPIVYITRPTLFGDNFHELFPWGMGNPTANEVRRHLCAKDQYEG